MSSVLQALQEREPRLTPAGGASTARHAHDGRAWRWAIVVGFVAGLAGVLLLRWPLETPPPAAPIPRPAVAVKPVERSAAVPTVRGKDEPPRARVERWTAPVAPAVPTEAVTGAVSPTTAQAAAPPVPTWAPGTASGVADPGPPADSGLEHVVRVQGVAYASAPERRTATLAIDGAPEVTLRQGESARGIEVQLILRDQVYLRYGADVFAAEVER